MHIMLWTHDKWDANTTNKQHKTDKRKNVTTKSNKKETHAPTYNIPQQ